MRRLLPVVAALLLVIPVGCTSDTGAPTTTQTVPTVATDLPGITTTVPIPATTMAPELVPAAFAQMAEIPLLDGATPYTGPEAPRSLDDVVIADPLTEAVAGAGLAEALVAEGFGVVPGDARLFHHVYQLDEYQPFPVFVTTDAAYHVWHLAFDKTLRDAEEEQLLPALERMVGGLVERSRDQRDELVGTVLADQADRVAQFYEAAATLLELDVGPIGPLAQEEVSLAQAADAVASSPTVGMVECGPERPDVCVFYELFRPRGHYTRGPDLERYFRVMSLLGQTPFPLDDQSLVVAALAVRPLLADDEALADWRLVYEPTAFLVGAADDYTPFELAAAASSESPGGLSDPVSLIDAIGDVAGRLRGTREVRINPEAASVRIMGVRLTLDSYLIDQLVDPNVAGRFVASARDVAAAFGSDFALDSMVAEGYTDYPGYDERLDELSGMVAARTIEDWSRTVYDAWLYALQPMWSEHGIAFPDFMQTPAWAAKAHQTGFASYAELKHDTILYTKQAMAEGGNGGEPPPPPRHWVEPDPVAFARIGAVTRMLREGLEARHLIGPENADTLSMIEAMMADLARLAEDELAGRPISQDDNFELQVFGHWLETIWLRTSDLLAAGDDAGPDEDAALVADIMRSAREGALEVATGKVDRIYVLVPDDSGRFQVAMGGVYSFYEFWQDPARRLTDEEWRVMLDTGQAPERPDWVGPILTGG